MGDQRLRRRQYGDGRALTIPLMTLGFRPKRTRGVEGRGVVGGRIMPPPVMRPSPSSWPGNIGLPYVRDHPKAAHHVPAIL